MLCIDKTANLVSYSAGCVKEVNYYVWNPGVHHFKFWPQILAQCEAA